MSLDGSHDDIWYLRGESAPPVKNLLNPPPPIKIPPTNFYPPCH